MTIPSSLPRFVPSPIFCTQEKLTSRRKAIQDVYRAAHILLSHLPKNIIFSATFGGSAITAHAPDKIHKKTTPLPIFQNIHDDVVLFSGLYSCPDFVEQLPEKGYNGKASLTPEKQSELLKKQNYIDMLKYVWTEKDINEKIAWLRPLAQEGHAILCFELSRALGAAHQNSYSSEIIMESMIWYLKGHAHTRFDCACIDDISCLSAIDALMFYYGNDSYDMPEKAIEKATPSAIKEIKRQILLELPLSENLPSPKWLAYHGIGMFTGRITLQAENLWLASRKKECAKYLHEVE